MNPTCYRSIYTLNQQPPLPKITKQNPISPHTIIARSVLSKYTNPALWHWPVLLKKTNPEKTADSEPEAAAAACMCV